MRRDALESAYVDRIFDIQTSTPRGAGGKHRREVATHIGLGPPPRGRWQGTQGLVRRTNDVLPREFLVEVVARGPLHPRAPTGALLHHQSNNRVPKLTLL